MIRIVFKIPLISRIMRRAYTVSDPRLHTQFLGLQLNSPVGLAAGFDKNGQVYNAFFDFGFSHVEVGTVTPRPQPGNPRPRSFRIPKDNGLINRMGFNNHGVDALVMQLQKRRRKGAVVGGNIGKNTLTPNDQAVDDYVTCFNQLYPYVDYFVVNVSCPNISDMHELQDQAALTAILSRLAALRSEKVTYVPILLKISPDLNKGQIDASLQIVDKYGIDGIVATNTTILRNDLVTSEQRIQAIGNGGMSGAPITRRSLEVVRYVSEKTGGRLPIIGVGGIMTVEDALNMLDAGAHLIQLYTGFIYNGPGFVRRINKALLARKERE
jgi:dihydroorotate dehydrogenase